MRENRLQLRGVLNTCFTLSTELALVWLAWWLFGNPEELFCDFIGVKHGVWTDLAKNCDRSDPQIRDGTMMIP